MMCLYCLKVFQAKFSKQSGFALTQPYYQHLVVRHGYPWLTRVLVHKAFVCLYVLEY